MRKTTFLLIIFIAIITLPTQAAVEVQSQRLTTLDGLANNTVRQIFQDSKGFIWMSTLNGLNRYDGNSFITFRPREDVKLSLADSRTRTLIEDNNGFLWISTTAELISCYDLKRDCFVDFTGCGEYLQKYAYISVMPDAVWVWGRTQGCRRITYENGTFSSEAFSMANGQMQSNSVQFLQSGEDNRVWIGTGQGLYCWHEGKFASIDNQHAFQWMCNLEGQNFFVSSKGEIWQQQNKELKQVAHIPNISSGYDLPGQMPFKGKWIISTSTGAVSFNPQTHALERAPTQLDIPRGETIKDNHNNYWVYNRTGKIHYYNVEQDKIKTLQLIPQESVNFNDHERYHVVHDSRGIIWISTYGNGLFAYEPLTEQLQHFKSGSGSSNSDLIASNFLQNVMEDRSGCIWVSSEYAGISQLRVINEGALRFYPDKKTENEYNNRIRLISQTRDGNVWLGNRSGEVYAYDAYLSVRKEKQSYASNIYAICEDASGIQWKASRGSGLYVGNKRYTHQVNDPTSISHNEVFCLLKDSKDRMWVGTFGGGLNLAIPDHEKGYIFRAFFTQTYGQKRIRVICEDHNGWLWVGTSEGLIVFDPNQLTETPEIYYSYNQHDNKLSSNEIRTIVQDSKNNIWIAESGTGFSICSYSEADYDKLQFTHYGVEDGLVNGMVQSFVEDVEGMMWISTEYGISRFNPVQKTFENYFFSDNIMGNVYNENCALKLPNGKLIFGTNDGLIIIDPQTVKSTQAEPSVTFTDLKINGISITSDEIDSPLRSSFAYTESIDLDYDQNSFVIDFSTLDYSNSIPPKYSYILDNYDKEWSVPSALSFAAYKNLSPGTYYLRVKACNATGLWGHEEAVLKILITPPFWRTTWAFLLYIILITGIIYLTFRTIRNMNELRYKIKVEEQLTEYKLIFFTNISHEFRTPLTLIQGALERIHRGKIPRNMSYAVKVMDKSTQRMLRLINQLLEFRKMQNNKLALSLEETDVIAFLHEIFLSFKDAADSKKMNFRFVSSIESYTMYIDKGNVDKVAYNMLSNAFKYTPSRGTITLEVNVDEGSKKLSIRVTDSGVGIPKEKRDQLFSRFMQSNFSGNSMGVGLHLTYELVNVHKGIISYEPNPEGGSIFTVVLPTDSSIYKEEDFLVADNILIREEDIIKKRFSITEEYEESEDKTEATEGDYPKPVETTDEDDTTVAPLNKRKILIIEDDNDVREFLVNELSVYFEVEAESDGTAGIERAYTYDADLIISDVLMPGYTGFEITKKLKDDFNTSHIPIILLTALSATENHIEGVESGADAYITKPFSTRLLLARVSKLIEQRDKLREKFSNDLTMVRPVICTNDRDKEFVDKLTSIIEAQLENPEFTVEDFASEMALGRTVFYRKVRGVTGYAPKEYLRVMRMKKAAELLITTDVTVSEVSTKVGINDPFYFSKCFKAQFGVSPSVYQKNGRMEGEA